MTLTNFGLLLREMSLINYLNSYSIKLKVNSWCTVKYSLGHLLSMSENRDAHKIICGRVSYESNCSILFLFAIAKSKLVFPNILIILFYEYVIQIKNINLY
jgi:hypothetical protein